MKNKKLTALIISLTVLTTTIPETVAFATINRNTIDVAALPTGSDIKGVLNEINEVVKQALSKLNDVIKRYTTSYRELPTKYNVDKNKDFEIKFNKDISFISVNSNTIKVVDSKGNEIPVKLKSKSTDKKVAIVEAPIDGYKEGETYALIVRKGLSSLNSYKLVDETVMKFAIADSSTGSTGGTEDNETVGNTRVNSVTYTGGTITNNNSYENKTYTALDRANILDKSKIMLSSILYKLYEGTFYHYTVDYQKSQDAYKNIDVLDSLFIRDDVAEDKIITVNFGVDVDPSSFINRQTMIMVPTGYSSTKGFNYDLESGLIEVLSVENGVVKLRLNRGAQLCDRSRYLIFYGIKDIKGNIIKPTIIPVWFDDVSGRRLKDVSNDGSWFYNYKDRENEFNQVTGIRATRLKTSIYVLSNWDSIKDSLQRYYPTNVDVMKELRNRMFKYQIAYEDLYINPNVNGSTMYIWDRFIINKKQVEVLYTGHDAALYVAIYDKGDSWNTNYNIVDFGGGAGYITSYMNKDYPALKWGYNYNDKYFNSLTY